MDVLPILQLLQSLLDVYSGKIGWIPQVLTIMGTCRLVFKPLVSLAQNYVQMTPSISDDAFLAKFLTSPLYKWISFVLDLAFSIKVPRPVVEAQVIPFPVQPPKDPA